MMYRIVLFIALLFVVCAHAETRPEMLRKIESKFVEIYTESHNTLHRNGPAAQSNKTPQELAASVIKRLQSNEQITDEKLAEIYERLEKKQHAVKQAGAKQIRQVQSFDVETQRPVRSHASKKRMNSVYGD